MIKLFYSKLEKFTVSFCSWNTAYAFVKDGFEKWQVDQGYSQFTFSFEFCKNETKERDVSQLQHIPHNLSRSSMCHSEKVNRVSWVLGADVALAPPRLSSCAHTGCPLLRALPSSSSFPFPPPEAAYPRGPYLACVQSDGMLGKQQSIHGDADAYTVLTQRVPARQRGPRWPSRRRTDCAQSKSRVTAENFANAFVSVSSKSISSKGRKK